jgi:hypothetical protein
LPALFAYLVAVGLLLGGGYGALTWLGTPEPVKVAAKVKPKPTPHYEAIPSTTTPSDPSVASSSETNAPIGGASNDTAAVAIDEKPSPEPTSQPSQQASEEKPAKVSEPVQDQQNRSASAEIPSAESKTESKPESKTEAKTEAKPEPRRVGEGFQSPSTPRTNRPQIAASASAAGIKMTNRPRLGQAAGSRFERAATPDRRRLAVMTLRTIEFPDGRRVSQLIPYRDAGRGLDD